MRSVLGSKSSSEFFVQFMGPDTRHLAVEAVIGEPVSVSHFPVVRENTGNFGRSRLAMAKLPSH